MNQKKEHALFGIFLALLGILIFVGGLTLDFFYRSEGGKTAAFSIMIGLTLVLWGYTCGIGPVEQTKEKKTEEKD